MSFHCLKVSRPSLSTEEAKTGGFPLTFIRDATPKVPLQCFLKILPQGCLGATLPRVGVARTYTKMTRIVSYSALILSCNSKSKSRQERFGATRAKDPLSGAIWPQMRLTSTKKMAVFHSQREAPTRLRELGKILPSLVRQKSFSLLLKSRLIKYCEPFPMKSHT